MGDGLRNAVLAVRLVGLVLALLVMAWRIVRVVLIAVFWLAAFLTVPNRRRRFDLSVLAAGAQPTRRTPLGFAA